MEMIEWQIRMAEQLGRPIATPAQTRQMMKIGVWYKTTDETLANIGLPPNREGSQQGFLVHKTDGRFHPPAQGGCGHIHAGEWEDDAVVKSAV
jgi:hypothetical protein